MKKNRLITLMLAIVMVMTIALTGCNGKKVEDTDTSAGTNKTDATTKKIEEDTSKAGASKLEPVKLTMYVIGNKDENDVNKVEEKIAELLKDDLNITLDYNTISWGDYTPKMEMKAAAREEYDLAFTSNWAFHVDTNAANGSFMPLNDDKDLMKKYAPKVIDVLGEDFWGAGRINGLNYAVPCYKEVSHAWGLMFPKEFIDRFGFDIDEINKLEDLTPWFEKLDSEGFFKNEGVYGMQALLGESPLKLLDYDQLDNNDRVPGALTIDPKDGNFTVINEWATDEFAQMCKLLYDWKKKGYIKEDAINDTDYNTDLAAKMMFSCVKSLKPGKDGEFAGNYGYPWVQKVITANVMSNRESTGAMMAISTTSKNPERALMFLEKLYTDKNIINTMYFGIEGVHYEKVTENSIKITEQGKENYNPGNNWRFGNQFINYTIDGVEDPNKYSDFLKFNKEAVPTKSLGFAFNPENVLSEISACEQVYSIYWPALCTGSEDPEKLIPKFIEELNNAGLEKVLAEKQKQLDEWLSKK